jgi:hypothetical protein
MAEGNCRRWCDLLCRWNYGKKRNMENYYGISRRTTERERCDFGKGRRTMGRGGVTTEMEGRLRKERGDYEKRDGLGKGGVTMGREG